MSVLPADSPFVMKSVYMRYKYHNASRHNKKAESTHVVVEREGHIRMEECCLKPWADVSMLSFLMVRGLRSMQQRYHRVG